MQHYSRTAVYKLPSGQLRPDTNVTVTVRDTETAAIVSLFEADETTPKNNPFTIPLADNGFFQFWTSRRRVNISIIGDNANITLTNVYLSDLPIVVSNNAALRALAEPNESAIVWMIGHTIINYPNSGTGMWLWDSTSSAADDDATVIQPNSAPATGRWRRQAVEYVTPQMFGARGTGAGDDVTALQNAFNSGIPVFIPHGTYRFLSELTVPAGAVIIGGGGHLFADFSHNTHGLVVNASNVVIRNLIIDDNGTEVVIVCLGAPGQTAVGRTIIGAGGSPDFTEDGSHYQYIMDGQADTCTMALDATPFPGRTFDVYGHHDSTNLLTITNNGRAINGQQQDLVLNPGESVTVRDIGTGWIIV